MDGILPRFGQLFLVSVFFGFVTIIYVNWIFDFYRSLETNHDPDVENFWKKVILLWRSNVIVSFLAAGVVVFYAPVIADLTSGISLETVVATAILIAISNFTIRIASYAYLDEEADRRSDQILKRQRRVSYNAMFSLMVSTWILLFIGLSINIMNGNTNIMNTYEPIGAVRPAIAVFYTLLIVITPFVLGYISEKLLWSDKSPFIVPNALIDNQKKNADTEVVYDEQEGIEAESLPSKESSVNEEN